MEEFAIRQIEYLKRILQRPEYSIKIEDMPSTYADNFLYLIIDEMRGYSIRIEKMTGIGWLKFFAICIFPVVSIFGYFRDLLDFGTMLTVVISTLLYAIFEFSRKQ